MGASLAHLVVMDFNLDTKQCVGQHCSIDVAAANPETKAATHCPIAESIKVANWSDTARIVRLIQVPLVLATPLVVTYGGVDTSKVDVSTVASYPVHQHYGGTSLGFGTDPALEARLESEPGFFTVDGVRFEIKEFASSVPEEEPAIASAEA